jgi:hypothetical protein
VEHAKIMKMGKHYMYRVLGNEQYKVMRVDDSKKRGEKGRLEEYHVNLKDGETMCSCPGFYFTKKSCKHIKFLLSQLADKGGILDFQHIGDYDRLFEQAKTREKRKEKKVRWNG